VTPRDEFPREVADDSGLYRDSDAPDAAAKKKAAVLVPLLRIDNAWHILYIVRASNPKDRHSGQVAFPGGRKDPTDTSLVHTALRETQEEIGVPATHIQVLGELTAYTTVSEYAVTPVVATMNWPVPLTLQTNEVASTLTIPVAWLNDRSNFSLRARNSMDKATADRHPVVVYEAREGDILWGATARMTLNCLKAFADGEMKTSPPLL